MDDAIQDMFAKKLTQCASDADRPSCRKRIELSLINSVPMEADIQWWKCRAWAMAFDYDRKGCDLTIGERLAWRNN